MGKNIFNITEYKSKDTNPLSSIEGLLNAVNKKPNIKRIIIDTINGVMVDKEMREVNKVGYSK